MIKRNTKIAFGSLISATATVIMLLAYFPYATYAVPAIAGVLFAAVNIEIGKKWAYSSYIITAVISLILCEKESAVLFTLFFGFYPIIKGSVESRFSSRVAEYIIKFLCFNLCIIVSYIIIVYVFGIPMDETGNFGKFFAAGLLLAGNVVFLIYDIGLTRLISYYFAKYHTKISKLLKR